jgi:predicted RNase H-related nuclease YkuK (DUF458 family)
MGGRLKHDVCDYITAMTSESDVQVHVGCDSQNHKRHTVYVTTVVFRFPNNGAHVIYRRERVPKIHDMWTKLWGETERSVALANLILEECGLRVHQIDLDFNSDSKYASHKLVSASSGYITSLGFESKVKPDLLMAAWAANVLCQ